MSHDLKKPLYAGVFQMYLSSPGFSSELQISKFNYGTEISIWLSSKISKLYLKYGSILSLNLLYLVLFPSSTESYFILPDV